MCFLSFILSPAAFSPNSLLQQSDVQLEHCADGRQFCGRNVRQIRDRTSFRRVGGVPDPVERVHTDGGKAGHVGTIFALRIFSIICLNIL